MIYIALESTNDWGHYSPGVHTWPQNLYTWCHSTVHDGLYWIQASERQAERYSIASIQRPLEDREQMRNSEWFHRPACVSSLQSMRLLLQQRQGHLAFNSPPSIISQRFSFKTAEKTRLVEQVPKAKFHTVLRAETFTHVKLEFYCHTEATMTKWQNCPTRLHQWLGWPIAVLTELSHSTY